METSAVSRMELLYHLYLFGCKRAIVSLNPLVVFPVNNVGYDVLTYPDFITEFESICLKWNTNVSAAYIKLKPAIDFLVKHQQL